MTDLSLVRAYTDIYRLYQPDELRGDGYPIEWHTEIKWNVREQAGNRCVRCHHPYTVGEHGKGEWTPCDGLCAHGGEYRYRNKRGERKMGVLIAPQVITLHVLNGTEVEARWRILTVHHLDGNKANCCWWNLAALCQRCHLTVQGRVVMARVWPWEHSDWFKPYVAGFYAHSYLGEELGRDEVEARLDELLALERMA